MKDIIYLFKKAFLFSFCVLAVSIIIAPSSYAATYYVNAGTGNDANAGTSSGAAWKTLTYAGTMSTVADTVNVAAGTYDEANGETFTAAKTITIRANFVSTTPLGATISCSSFNASTVSMESGSLDGFYITNSSSQTRYPVYIKKTGTTVQIKNCQIRANWASGYGQKGIYIGSTTINSTIEGCTIEADLGIYEDAGGGNMRINNNTIIPWHSSSATLTHVGMYLSATGEVSSNEVRGLQSIDGYTGIWFAIGSGARTVTNNTIVNCTRGVSCSASSVTVTARNNIITGSPTGAAFGTAIVQSSGTVTSEYNSLYNNVAAYSGTVGSKTGDITTNPKFVLATATDFRVYNSSPCRGTGLGGVDMGRYPALAAPANTIHITSPTGGETWNRGTKHNITWSTTGTVASVKLYASINNGMTFSLITTESDSGTFSWFVTNSATSQAVIRALATDGSGNISEESSSAFTIAASTTEVVYYVNSSTGSNANDGASDTPWKTITYAATMAAAGDTVSVAPGIYTSAEGEVFPITISNRNFISSTTYLATIEDTAAVNAHTYILSVSGASLEGFDIKGNGYGLSTSYAVIANGNNVTIQNNKIRGQGYGWGVYHNGSTNLTIEANVIYKTTNTTDTSIYGIYLSGSDGIIKIISNEVRSFGVGIYDSSAATATTTITDNTLVKNHKGVVVASGTTSTIKNNIVAGEVGDKSAASTVGISRSTGTANSTYNNIYLCDATYEGTVSDKNGDIYSNPLFYDATANDYRILSSSPAATSGEGGAVMGCYKTLVTAPTVTLSKPNGGETLTAATYYNITWESTESPTSINLRYSTNEGSSYTLITSEVANTGTYSWFVPNFSTSTALVSIEAVKGAITATDVSNATFTITPTSTYYVNASTGSNTYDGLTNEVSGTHGPWKTITYGATACATGSTVNVAAGTYNSALGESFPITITGRNVKSSATPSTAAIINEDGSATYAFTLAAAGTLDGFTIQGNGGSSGRVINISGANAIVKNNTISAEGYSYGVYIGADSATVESNKINKASISSSTYGVYCVGTKGKFDIRKNEVRSFYYGVFYDTNSGSTSGTYNNYILNNTFIKNTTGVYVWYSVSGSTMHIKNNIMSSNPILGEPPIGSSYGIYIYAGSPVTGYNNQWNNTTNSYYYATTAPTTDVIVCPRFINPAVGTDNYNLSFNSPCIDRGDPTILDPDGTVSDIGAYYFDLSQTGTMAVYLKTPSTSETISALSSYPITWYATKEGAVFDHIALHYTTDNGATYNQITASTPNDGTHDWTVPNVSAASAEVRVTAVPASGNSVTDESDSIITLEAMSVTLRTPNGGDSFFAGAARNITWETTSSPDTINIYYTTNESWIPIATGETDDGTYSWNVPNAITSEAKVKLEAIKSGGYIATDESAAVFSIMDSVVYVNAASGNDTTGTGTLLSPWKSITKAASVVGSGCTINAAAGTYNTIAGETFPISIPAGVILKSLASPTTSATIDATGSSFSYPNYHIVQLGAAATIDGFSVLAVANDVYGVQLAGNTGQVINNRINVRPLDSWSSARGININSSVTSSTIGGNTIYAKNDGVYLNDTNTSTTIQNNFISAETSACIYMNGAADSLTVSGNTLEAHDSGGSYAKGIYSGGTALNSLYILNNTIRGIGSSSPNGIEFNAAVTGTIESNEISKFSSTSWGSGNGIKISSGTIKIKNNDIIKNLTGISINSGTITINDNIISAGPTVNGSIASSVGINYSGGTVTSDHNDVFNNTTNWSGISSGEGDISVNPKFVSVFGNDLRLCSDSLCIGAGTGGANIGRNLGVGGVSNILTNSYVDDSAADNSGAGDITGPWKNIGFALENTTGTVNIRAGTYNVALGETFPLLMVSGQVLKGYTGETVNIDAATLYNVISGGSNCTVEGLVIKNPKGGGMGGTAAGYGVSLGTGSRIINNTFTDDGTLTSGNAQKFCGVFAGGTSEISGNTITFTGGGGFGIGLDSSNNCSILNNNITTASQVNNGGGISGYGWGSAGANILIQGNSIECTYANEVGIYLSSATDFNVTNNTIVGPGGTSGNSGVYLSSSYGTVETNTIRGFCGDSGYGINNSNYGSGTVEVNKNTIVKNKTGIYNSSGTLTAKNNIIASEVGGYSVASSVGLTGTLTSTYNDVFANDTGWSTCASGEGDKEGDPAFTNATTNDLTLTATSAAIDAGTPEGTDMGRFAYSAPITNPPTVEVTLPNGGEKLAGGSSYNITYTATDAAGLKASPITFRYSTNSGTAWTQIATSQAYSGTYAWTVPSVNSANCRVSVEAINVGDLTGTDMSNADFTIDSTSPEAPTLIYPGPYAIINDNTPTLTWSGTADAISYEVTVDSTVKATTEATSYESAALTDASHTWKVRAKDAAGNWSGYSALWAFTVDTAGPPAPSLSSPSNGSTTGSATPTLSWTGTSDAVSYEVRVDGVVKTTTEATSYVSATLTNASHTWDVRAKDAVGNWGAFSANWTFTVNTVGPTPPSLISPADGSTTSESTPTLTWGTAEGSIYNYEVRIDLTTIATVGSSTYSYVPVVDLADGVHTWEVRAKNNLGIWGAYATAYTFTVDTTGPAAPTLVTPANSATVATATPTLTWEAVSGAVSYEVRVDGIFKTTTEATSYVSATLTEASHTWDVRAKDSLRNWGAYATAYTFTVDTTGPAAPTLVTPANAATVATATPTLTWEAVSGAVSYEVRVDGVVGTTTEGTTYTTGTLTQASHTWDVRANDSLGNWGNYASAYTFTVVLSTPTVSGIALKDSVSGNTSYAARRVVSVEASGVTNQYQMMLSESSAFTGAAWITYENPTTFELSSGDGAKTIYYKINDTYGSVTATVEATITLDTTAPTVSITAPTAGITITAETYSITWSAADGGSGLKTAPVIIYATSTESWPQLTSGAAASGSYTWTIPTIESTAYRVKITAEDQAGNIGAATTESFTVNNPTPADTPVIPDPGTEEAYIALTFGAAPSTAAKESIQNAILSGVNAASANSVSVSAIRAFTITGSFVWSNGDRRVEFTPEQPLTEGKRYTISIPSGLTYTNGTTIPVVQMSFVAQGVLADTVAPEIVIKAQGLAIRNNDYIDARPSFEVTLSDNTSIVPATLSMSLDNSVVTPVTVSQAAKSMVVSYSPTTDLADEATATHTVSAEVKDGIGHKTTKTITGLKVGTGQVTVMGTVMSTPTTFSPKKDGTSVISYSLNKSAPVGIYLYGQGSGSVAWTRKFSQGANGAKAGYNTVTFSGVSDISGSTLANGIYVYKIISNNKEIGKGYVVIYE